MLGSNLKIGLEMCNKTEGVVGCQITQTEVLRLCAILDVCTISSKRQKQAPFAEAQNAIQPLAFTNYS
jgi:hypothetical protein